MKPLFIAAFLVVLAAGAIAGLKANELKLWLGDVTMPLREGMYRSRNVMVPMRDGVRLATDVYRPGWGNGQHPVILIRTTYGGVPFKEVKQFVDQDYAVVVQHVRGRYYSEGTYESPYWTAGRDGYDTIDWIVSQPWATDRVGTFGCSYLGESQIILAAENHPNHIAMIAMGAGGAIGKAMDSYGYFGVFENGVLNLASSLGWFTAEGAKNYKVTPRPDDYEDRMRQFMDHLPVSELNDKMVPYETGFDGFVNHPLTDSWWDKEGYIHPEDEFSVATLHINDWFDQTAHNTFRLAEHMATNTRHPRAKSQHVLISPGLHCTAGKLSAGRITIGEMTFEYAEKDFQKVYIDWFDYWLKDKEEELPSPFEYYAIHSGEWRQTSQWPPLSSQNHRFYLASDNRLQQDKPDKLAQDSRFYEFSYDPSNPVPTIGGPICCTFRAEDKPGPLDQTALGDRQDVISFSTDTLENDTELEGNAKAVLYVSTDALDTDFTVKMIDHYPNGKSYNLQDGVVRLRYRDGIDNPQLAEPGAVYRIELELRPIAYRFRKGHRIGIQISSSNFPRLARNLNTGANEYHDDRTVVATNRIYLGGDTASYLQLPLRSSNTSSDQQ